MCEYYTEGDYNGLVPFNTLNQSKEEEMKIQDWTVKMYNKALNNLK